MKRGRGHRRVYTRSDSYRPRSKLATRSILHSLPLRNSNQQNIQRPFSANPSRLPFVSRSIHPLSRLAITVVHTDTRSVDNIIAAPFNTAVTSNIQSKRQKFSSWLQFQERERKIYILDVPFDRDKRKQRSEMTIPFEGKINWNIGETWTIRNKLA